MSDGIKLLEYHKGVIICGIDPGTASLGYSFINLDSSQKVKLLDCGIIHTSKDKSDADRLWEIRKDLHELFNKYKPSVLAVEKIFFFKNPKTLVPVAQARGVVLGLGAELNLEIHEYTPLEVKKIITGNGMADKKLVAKLVQAELNLDSEIKQDDAVDAIAIAICFLRTARFTTLR